MTRMFVMEPPGNSIVQLLSQGGPNEIARKAADTEDNFISKGSLIESSLSIRSSSHRQRGDDAQLDKGRATGRSPWTIRNFGKYSFDQNRGIMDRIEYATKGAAWSTPRRRRLRRVGGRRVAGVTGPEQPIRSRR